MPFLNIYPYVLLSPYKKQFVGASSVQVSIAGQTQFFPVQTVQVSISGAQEEERNAKIETMIALITLHIGEMPSVVDFFWPRECL